MLGPGRKGEEGEGGNGRALWSWKRRKREKGGGARTEMEGKEGGGWVGRDFKY